MAYEWFGEVLMALSTRLGGLPGQKVCAVILAGLLFLLLYYYSYLRSKNIKAAFLACTLLVPLAAVFFTFRPQLIGYVFLVTTLICLERFRQGNQKALWLLPLVFLVWINTHGSFAFGLFVIGLYWMAGLVHFQQGGLIAEPWTAPQRLRLEVLLLLCVLATLVTPSGTRMAAYPLELALAQPVNVASIQEWQPLGPDIWIAKLAVGLLLLYFLAQVMLRQTYRLQDMALLLFAAFSAFLHRRFLIVFLIVLAPALAELLARIIPAYRADKEHPALNATLIFFVVLGTVRFFPSQEELERVLLRDYPQKAVAYLRSHPVKGPMFNEYRWGGYLIRELYPQQKVFIDGRADIYEYGGVLSDYSNIVLLKPDALSSLRKYGVQACLVRKKDAISTLLAASPEWELQYSDELSALFVRKGSQEFPDMLSATPRPNSPAGLERTSGTL
jgi:hypothetical protein